MRWAFALALATTCIPAPGSAQIDDVRVVMLASDDAPEVGEPFQLQIEARQSGNASAGGMLVPPSFGALRVVGTTGQMRQQSIQQVFGSAPQVEARTSIVFQVVADRPGIYRIAPASYRVGRRTIESEPLVVKVGEGTAPVTDPGETPRDGTEAYEYDPQLFLRSVVDRRDPYVGQQLTYTLYLYVAARTDGTPRVARQPSHGDFWIHDLRGPQPPPPTVQVIRGVPYRVHVLQRVALFPLHAGTIEIDAGRVELESSGFAAMFGGQTETIVREGARLRIDVRPLPPGTPADAIVGRATIESSLDHANVRTGEAATLTVTIRGSGSLRNATVALPAIDGLRIEAPAIEDHVDSPSDLVGGDRTLRFQIVAQRPGTFTLPPLAIATFDPATGQLERPRTAPLTLVATGAPILEPDEPAPAADEEPDDEAASSDLRFGPASRSSAMRRRALPIHGRWYYAPLVLSVPLAALLVVLVRAATGAARSRRAASAGVKTPKQPLARAKKAIGQADTKTFYASITAALHGALEGASGEKTAGMTHAEIRQMLLARGADEELARRVVDELDAADFARFSASGGSPDEMRRTHERATALVTRLARTPLTEVAT